MERLRRILWKIYKLDLTDQIEDIKEVLTGFGGSCEVFIGRYPRLRKKVAIKRLRIFLQKEDQFAEKLTGEIYIWSKLDHPNVLQFLGFYLEDSGFPNLVSEWMENGTLFDYMPNISSGIASLNMAIGIAEGLSYLHSMGVIHADLKSSNVLISSKGLPLLADYGVSKILNSSITMVQTTGHSTKGTVRWMAIELLDLTDDDDEDAPVHNTQTDVWAFGMVIYEILSRKVPFAHLKADVQVVMAITKGKVPKCPTFSKDMLVSSVEQRLWQLCEQCWKPEPEERPSLSQSLISLRKGLQDQNPSSREVLIGESSIGVRKEEHSGGGSATLRQMQERGEISEVPMNGANRSLLSPQRSGFEGCENNDSQLLSTNLVNQGSVPVQIPKTPSIPPLSSPVLKAGSSRPSGNLSDSYGMFPGTFLFSENQRYPSVDILDPKLTPPPQDLSFRNKGKAVESGNRRANTTAEYNFPPLRSDEKVYHMQEKPLQFHPRRRLDKRTPPDASAVLPLDNMDRSSIEASKGKPHRLVLATTKPESNVSMEQKLNIKWTCGELVGKGRYYRSYLAMNTETGELMVVKEVAVPRTDSDDRQESLATDAMKNESIILKNLNHPNVVKFLGFEQTADMLRLVTEYVPDGSLERCLRKHGRFEDKITRSFTGQILAGLEYLHCEKGVLHRYIKSENILVDASGVCRISDFSISKQTVDVNENICHTPMQGSIFWMAPEVVHRSTKEDGYNGKADVWSLGCLVHEMWSGHRPWTEMDAVSVMYEAVTRKDAPPVPPNVVLSSEADDFHRKCLAPKPDDRPSPTELRQHPYLVLPPGWKFTGFK